MWGLANGWILQRGGADILKLDFLRGQNCSFEILRKIKCKIHATDHNKCVNQEKEILKEAKMQKKKTVFTYKSQDWGQYQEIVERSHNRETVTFRNSGVELEPGGMYHWGYPEF